MESDAKKTYSDFETANHEFSSRRIESARSAFSKLPIKMPFLN